MPTPLASCLLCKAPRPAGIRIRVRVPNDIPFAPADPRRARAEEHRGERIPACEPCARDLQGKEREKRVVGQHARHKSSFTRLAHCTWHKCGRIVAARRGRLVDHLTRENETCPRSGDHVDDDKIVALVAPWALAKAPKSTRGYRFEDWRLFARELKAPRAKPQTVYVFAKETVFYATPVALPPGYEPMSVRRGPPLLRLAAPVPDTQKAATSARPRATREPGRPRPALPLRAVNALDREARAGDFVAIVDPNSPTAGVVARGRVLRVFAASVTKKKLVEVDRDDLGRRVRAVASLADAWVIAPLNRERGRGVPKGALGRPAILGDDVVLVYAGKIVSRGVVIDVRPAANLPGHVGVTIRLDGGEQGSYMLDDAWVMPKSNAAAKRAKVSRARQRAPTRRSVAGETCDAPSWLRRACMRCGAGGGIVCAPCGDEIGPLVHEERTDAWRQPLKAARPPATAVTATPKGARATSSSGASPTHDPTLLNKDGTSKKGTCSDCLACMMRLTPEKGRNRPRGACARCGHGSESPGCPRATPQAVKGAKCSLCPAMITAAEWTNEAKDPFPPRHCDACGRDFCGACAGYWIGSSCADCAEKAMGRGAGASPALLQRAPGAAAAGSASEAGDGLTKAERERAERRKTKKGRELARIAAAPGQQPLPEMGRAREPAGGADELNDVDLADEEDLDTWLRTGQSKKKRSIGARDATAVWGSRFYCKTCQRDTVIVPGTPAAPPCIECGAPTSFNGPQVEAPTWTDVDCPSCPARARGACVNPETKAPRLNPHSKRRALARRIRGLVTCPYCERPDVAVVPGALYKILEPHATRAGQEEPLCQGGATSG